MAAYVRVEYSPSVVCSARFSEFFVLRSNCPRPGLNLVDLNATIRNNATSNCSAFC